LPGSSGERNSIKATVKRARIFMARLGHPLMFCIRTLFMGHHAWPIAGDETSKFCSETWLTRPRITRKLD